jgi:hypothetical protein
MNFKKVAQYLTLYTLGLLIMTFLMIRYLSFVPDLVGWPFLLLYIYVVNLLMFYILSKYFAKKPLKFVNAFMLASFGKMMAYIVFLLLYVFLNPQQTVPFVIMFLLYFIFYLVLEVVLLQKPSRLQ